MTGGNACGVELRRNWSSPSRTEVWIGVALVVTALIIRLFHYHGVLASDPLLYLEYARQLAEGTYELELHHYATRYAVWMPITALSGLLGSWELAAVAWPLLCSLATVWLSYRIAVLHGGLVAGVVCGALLVTLPVDVELGTQVLPETVLTAALTAAVFTSYRGLRTERAGWYLLAGFLVWCAYSAKMLGALMLPVLLIVPAVGRSRWRGIGVLLCGFATPMAIETLFYAAATGDPLFRVAAAAGGPHARAPMVEFAARDQTWRFFGEYPRQLLLEHGAFGLVSPFLIAGIAYGCWRFRSYPVLVGWITALGLFLNFGVTSLDPILPLPAAPRYLLPVLVPALILTGCLAAEIWRVEGATSCRDRQGWWSARITVPGWRKAAVVTAALTMVLFSLCFAHVSVGRSYTGLTGSEMNRVASWISERSLPAVVFADPRSRSALWFHLGYRTPPAFEPIPAGVGECEAAVLGDDLGREAVVVVNWREVNNRGSYSRYECGQRRTVERLASRSRPALRIRPDPDKLFAALTQFTLFRAAVPSDTRKELLHSSGSRRGSWVYRVCCPGK